VTAADIIFAAGPILLLIHWMALREIARMTIEDLLALETREPFLEGTKL